MVKKGFPSRQIPLHGMYSLFKVIAIIHKIDAFMNSFFLHI